MCGQLDPAELVNAIAAFRKGNPQPLLAIADDHRPGSGDPGNPSEFSAGATSATACSDQDFVWNRTDPIAVRERKYRAALAALPPNAFAPFSKRSWVTYLYEGCLMWPAPDRFVPAVPANATFPNLPTLMLVGDSDTAVPREVSETLHAEFPHATFVLVAGAGHPVAGPAWGHCAAELVGSDVRLAQDHRLVVREDPADLSRCPTAHARIREEDDEPNAAEGGCRRPVVPGLSLYHRRWHRRHGHERPGDRPGDHRRRDAGIPHGHGDHRVVFGSHGIPDG